MSRDIKWLFLNLEQGPPKEADYNNFDFIVRRGFDAFYIYHNICGRPFVLVRPENFLDLIDEVCAVANL